MEGRFISLGSHPKWSQAVKNPYNLFVIVLDHLFREMTQQTWNLGIVFRDIELVSQASIESFIIYLLAGGRQPD